MEMKINSEDNNSYDMSGEIENDYFNLDITHENVEEPNSNELDDFFSSINDELIHPNLKCQSFLLRNKTHP